MPYSDDHGNFNTGWTIVIIGFGVVAIAASVYLVYVLEIVKFRRFRERQLAKQEGITQEEIDDGDRPRDRDRGVPGGSSSTPRPAASRRTAASTSSASFGPSVSALRRRLDPHEHLVAVDLLELDVRPLDGRNGDPLLDDLLDGARLDLAREAREQVDLRGLAQRLDRRAEHDALGTMIGSSPRRRIV